jgi:aspartyl-tRNA(Asn)/glutamyl-tRNA(Gln) amidotransferase subunit C
VVSKEEIEQVTKLMKIDVHDHKEFIDKVHAMINYFDILDSAGVQDEEIVMNDVPLFSLRDDKHIPYQDKLIERLNHYKGTYVRAPKMV